MQSLEVYRYKPPNVPLSLKSQQLRKGKEDSHSDFRGKQDPVDYLRQSVPVVGNSEHAEITPVSR